MLQGVELAEYLRIIQKLPSRDFTWLHFIKLILCHYVADLCWQEEVID